MEAQLKDKIPFKSTDTASRIIEGQAVVIHLKKQPAEINIFNQTGTRVWELLDGKRTIEEIVREIYEEFEISRGEAFAEVAKFILNLGKKDLISF
ncbi:MAG: PqqD family protein [Candidatus Omnitrophota bacterium]|jgi:hypothetical protein